MTRALVVIPTYQEADNIEQLLRGIRAAAPEVDVLVVDDNSPDGTADVADAVGGELGRIDVLRRARKSGLGSAYRDGFTRAIHDGYDTILEMDADLSHDPSAIPTLLHEMHRGADVAIGSRYMAGGSIPTWSARRRALSGYGNRYAAWALGLAASDLTSGFRAFRASTLLRVDYGSTTATGYAFQIELANRAARAGCRIAEVPIVFNDRTRGRSKMSIRITLEALALVTGWAIRDRLLRRRVRSTRAHTPTGAIV